LADQNSIPLDDLIESLRGFENFFQITDSIFVQGRLAKRPWPEDYRIEIRVRRIAPGSIVAVLEFVGLALATGIIGNAGYDFLKRLWKWRVAVLENRTKPSRIPWSIEENVAALEALAREHDIVYSEGDDDPADIVQDLNASLHDALAPVAHSVETITLASEEAGVEVALGRAEKATVESQPVVGYTPVESGEWKPAEVSFVRIHTGTGHALIKFRTPQREEMRGTKPCTIVDAGFKRPNDPFTRAMSRRDTVRVSVRKAILNSQTGAFRWEVALAPPATQASLFERTHQGGEQPPPTPPSPPAKPPARAKRGRAKAHRRKPPPSA
jgi:hypothetical protein